MLTDTGEIARSSADAFPGSDLGDVWAPSAFSRPFSSSSKRFFLSDAFATASEGADVLDEVLALGVWACAARREAKARDMIEPIIMAASE